jgi:hypothetical protein
VDPPFLENPGAQRNPGPEAGRRPGDLLRTTPRDQHLEINRVRRSAGPSRPLTRRVRIAPWCRLTSSRKQELASTLPHIRSGRLIDAGLHERISGAGEEVHVGSLRAPASPAEAGVASSSDACPRLVRSGRPTVHLRVRSQAGGSSSARATVRHHDASVASCGSQESRRGGCRSRSGAKKLKRQSDRRRTRVSPSSATSSGSSIRRTPAFAGGFFVVGRS